MKNFDLFLNEIQSIESNMNDFDHALYYELYPDLKANKVNTYIQLYQHYLRVGKMENRITNYNDFYKVFPYFDYKFYISNNKDIQNTLQIKYSTKVFLIPERFKERFAIIHYFLFGQYQNRLTTNKELVEHIPNPENLNESLPFLKGPKLTDVNSATNYYNAYLETGNSIVINEIDSNSDIGSLLFVDNKYPLNINYSQNIKEINNEIFIKKANINTISISNLLLDGNTVINNDLIINGNLFLNSNIYNTVSFSNTFIYNSNLVINGDLTLNNIDINDTFNLNCYKSINFNGVFNIIENSIKLEENNYIKFSLTNITKSNLLNFEILIENLCAETQSLFITDNTIINLNSDNQLEIIVDNNFILVNNYLELNKWNTIIITNNYVSVNNIIQDIVNINIDYNNIIIGNNIIISLFLKNIFLKNSFYIDITDTINVLENNPIMTFNKDTSIIKSDLLLTSNLNTNSSINCNELITSKLQIDNLFSVSNTCVLIGNINLNPDGNLLINNLNTNYINSNIIITNNINSNIINSNVISNSIFYNDIIYSNNINGNLINSQELSSNKLNSNNFISNEIITSNLQVQNIILDNVLTYTTTNSTPLTITENSIGIFNNSPLTHLDINGDVLIKGNLIIDNSISVNKINSNLNIEGTISNSIGTLYGPIILLQWSYFDIPVGEICNFGLSEPGNNTGYTGSQFSSGFGIQNCEVINNSARLIIRCQDISQLYNGPIGKKTVELIVCQLRYQGGNEIILYNTDIKTTYTDLSKSFTCNVDTSKGYFTVVSPFFQLQNLDVPSLGIRVLSMTNKGTYLRIGPTYLQFA